MKKGMIALASVVALTVTVVSCNLINPTPAPKTGVDSPKTIIDTTMKDTAKKVVDSTKK